MSLGPPDELLHGLAVKDKGITMKWWASLSSDDRDQLTEMYENDEGLPTFSFDLVDEFIDPFQDDSGDRYEYLVNHEHKPIGMTIGNPTVPLPAIPLLSPAWPPYSVELRCEPWEFTDSLCSRLQDELDRVNRRTASDHYSGLDNKTLASLWHAERQLRNKNQAAMDNE